MQVNYVKKGVNTTDTSSNYIISVKYGSHADNTD